MCAAQQKHVGAALARGFCQRSKQLEFFEINSRNLFCDRVIGPDDWRRSGRQAYGSGQVQDCHHASPAVGAFPIRNTVIRTAVSPVPAVASTGTPAQFVHESRLGPPELPPGPGPRPPTIVNLDQVERREVSRPRISRTRRNMGLAAGSVTIGLQHVEVAPGKESAPPHCHSLEEEIFVMLTGDGTLGLGEEEIPVRPGHVVARPPATRVPHVFRAGGGGLTYLAFGTREPGDVCYYPRSNKVNFGGVGVIARLERLDYWDGED